MFSNQLGRRNLTEEQRTYLRGKLYEARKHAVSNEEGRNQYSKEVSPQIGNQPNRVSEQIAKEQNVGKNTVLRAEKFSQGIDAIREVSSETADAILRGETKVTKQDVSMVAKAEPEERKRMVQQIEKGEKITPVAVPDKIVNKPENKYAGGGTAEDMKSLLCFSANFLRRPHQSSSINADRPSASSTHEASYFTRSMMALQTGHSLYGLFDALPHLEQTNSSRRKRCVRRVQYAFIVTSKSV